MTGESGEARRSPAMVIVGRSCSQAILKVPENSASRLLPKSD